MSLISNDDFDAAEQKLSQRADRFFIDSAAYFLNNHSLVPNEQERSFLSPDQSIITKQISNTENPLERLRRLESKSFEKIREIESKAETALLVHNYEDAEKHYSRSAQISATLATLAEQTALEIRKKEYQTRQKIENVRQAGRELDSILMLIPSLGEKLAQNAE